MVRLVFVMIAGFGVGVVTFLAGFGTGAMSIYKLMSSFESEPVKTNYQTVDFPLAPATLYLTARRWGLGGQHEEVRICDAPVSFNESGNCLRFYTDELFYDRAGENEFVVYVSRHAVPTDQSTHLGIVKVKVRELDGIDAEVVRRDYEQLGLMRIYAP